MKYCWVGKIFKVGGGYHSGPLTLDIWSCQELWSWSTDKKGKISVCSFRFKSVITIEYGCYGYLFCIWVSLPGYNEKKKCRKTHNPPEKVFYLPIKCTFIFSQEEIRKDRRMSLFVILMLIRSSQYPLCKQLVKSPFIIHFFTSVTCG